MRCEFDVMLNRQRLPILAVDFLMQITMLGLSFLGKLLAKSPTEKQSRSKAW